MADYSTRSATPDDHDAILALFPRLADFELPPRRTPEMFWSSDAKLLEKWRDGAAPDVFVRVATTSDAEIVGVAMVTMNQDVFSRQSNAHLEVLVIAARADGHGLGRRLVEEAQDEARRHGALSMSLAVVANNERARAVYAKLGFREELIRSVRFFDDVQRSGA